jgi:hypothetical protein
MMRFLWLPWLLHSTLLVGQAPAVDVEAVESITRQDIMRRVSIIADDSMLGRATPSRGLELTARYVAAQFQRAGLRPAGGDGSYIQRFGFAPRGKDGSRLRVEAPNVLGILEGRDPVLRSEYVVFSAHIDHLGVTAGLRDSINNGADDNGSGVAGLLELAEAFAHPGARPRRSLLFLAPSGEELGLRGSAYFMEHPTVPLQQIVANINMDLIGRNWRDSVIVVGLEQSDLGETLDRVVKAHPELHMAPIPDRWPEEQIFYRSDHFNFARKGVPILFFTSGTHPDYHQPSDEPGRIDGEKESRLVRLLFHLGAAVATQSSRPKWRPESYRQVVESK